MVSFRVQLEVMEILNTKDIIFSKTIILRGDLVPYFRTAMKNEATSSNCAEDKFEVLKIRKQHMRKSLMIWFCDFNCLKTVENLPKRGKTEQQT